MKEAKKQFWVFMFWVILAIIIWTIAINKAYADNRHYYPPVQTVTEVTNVTELVNTTNIDNYSVDKCQSVAIAQAGANNQMYMGTKKPQLSIGVGECDGELASSLMFGMRINNNLLLTGSWGADESVNGFGIGATVIFK